MADGPIVNTSASADLHSSEITFPYDISIDLTIDIPISGCDTDKTIAAASITLVSDIFVKHPEWNFLATPMIKALDNALLDDEHKWVTSDDRLVFKKDLHIRGNLVNIKDQPTRMSPTFGKLSYNGCVHSSKVLLQYKVEFHFLPGIRSAQGIYEAHEWRRNDVAQTDNSRSIKLREILHHHQEKKSLNYDFTWREGFFFNKNSKDDQQSG